MLIIVVTKILTQGVIKMKVWLQQVGHSQAYRSWDEFADEAKRFGFSRRVPLLPAITNNLRVGDIILFCEKIGKLRRGEKIPYKVNIRGFGVVQQILIHPKNLEAAEALQEALARVNAVKSGAGQQRVERRCGYYLVDSGWTIDNWDEFFDVLAEKCKERDLSLWDGFTALIAGKFYELESPIEFPQELTYSRMLRMVNDDVIGQFADIISAHAFVTDQPNLLILSRYLQVTYKAQRKNTVLVKLPTDNTPKRLTLDELALLL